MRKISAFATATALLVLFAPFASLASAESGENAAAEIFPESACAAVQDIITEAEWILGCTAGNGAIQWYPNMGRINPYAACFAAIGLVDAYRITLDLAYLQTAKGWILWYADHQNFPDVYGLNGSIYDYVLADGIWAPTFDYDSADAIAGMYLKTIWEYYEATLDLPLLLKLKPNIDGAVGCILGLQDSDGLTWAKTNWHVKYLMDNAEAYAGLSSAEKLYFVIGEHKNASAAKKSAAELKEGIHSLWDDERQSFDWAKHESGATQQNDYRIWYADCMEQIWPIYFGVVKENSRHAKAIWQKINELHQNWTNPDNVWTNPQSGESCVYGYWNAMVTTAKMMGDDARYEEAVILYRQAYLPEHNWPWECGCAGQRITSLAAGLSIIA